MVVVGVILLGIEDFEQRGRGVSPEIRAHLVHFVQAEDGIVEFDALERLDDLAGQRADIGAPMAADLGLVAHAAQGQAHELAAHGLGDGLGERRLADAGGADQTKDGALDAFHELLYGEVFEDAFLGLFKAVVVLVENALGGRDVEVGFLVDVPGQVQDPFHIVAHDRVFGRGRRNLAQLLDLAKRFLPGLVGHVLFAQARLEFGGLGAGIVLAAHLLVDGLDLLV
ncbi:hypothetical protein DSECCO2_473240 [anaerobic digester metagenome]